MERLLDASNVTNTATAQTTASMDVANPVQMGVHIAGADAALEPHDVLPRDDLLRSWRGKRGKSAQKEEGQVAEARHGRQYWDTIRESRADGVLMLVDQWMCVKCTVRRARKRGQLRSLL